MPTSYDIKLDRVSFFYRSNFHVLKNLNLFIPFQEKLAIVGASGIGKTSLLHLLARFYDPIEGEVSIGGVSLRNLCEIDLRNFTHFKSLNRSVGLVTFLMRSFSPVTDSI